MDQETIRGLVIGKLGGVSNIDSTINIWIDAGQKECAKHFDPKGLQDIDTSISTADGVEYVAEPSNCKNIVAVKCHYSSTEVKTLDKIPMVLRERWFPVTLSETKPLVYSPWGGNLYLRPTPDDIYSLTITYNKWPIALATDSSEPEIENVELAIAAFAASFGFTDYGEPELSEKSYNDAVRFLTGNVKVTRRNPDAKIALGRFTPDTPQSSFSGGFNAATGFEGDPIIF